MRAIYWSKIPFSNFSQGIFILFLSFYLQFAKTAPKFKYFSGKMTRGKHSLLIIHLTMIHKNWDCSCLYVRILIYRCDFKIGVLKRMSRSLFVRVSVPLWWWCPTQRATSAFIRGRIQGHISPYIVPICTVGKFLLPN